MSATIPTRRANSIKSKPYGGHKVLDHNGELIFRCADKKLRWYLQRDLATIVHDGPQKTIQLKFIPAGNGNKGDVFALAEKKNICVVCGSEEELSRHHIIPQSYRRLFPTELKNNFNHDVLLCCLDCHMSYENEALLFKRALAERYDAPIYGERYIELQRVSSAYGFARSIVEHGDVIPVDKQLALMEKIKTILNLEKVDLDVILELSENVPRDNPEWNLKTHSELVLENVDDLEEFIKMWRSHFVTTMNPQYLPHGWSVDYRRVR